MITPKSLPTDLKIESVRMIFSSNSPKRVMIQLNRTHDSEGTTV